MVLVGDHSKLSPLQKSFVKKEPPDTAALLLVRGYTDSAQNLIYTIAVYQFLIGCITAFSLCVRISPVYLEFVEGYKNLD